MPLDLDQVFDRYAPEESLVPVWFVTPHSPRSMHRFFDTSPISPSGKWLALTRFPDDRKEPEPGDKAEVILVDLQTGELNKLAETAAWDGQLGAQVQWGANDNQLFYNQMNPGEWPPWCVVMDPATGISRDLEGTVYTASRDGTKLVSPCLQRIRRTQAGYGVRVPDETMPINYGAPEDDGIYITDVASGKKRLAITLRQIVDACGLPDTETDIYGYYAFHTKWNPSASRISIKLRRLNNEGMGQKMCSHMWVITAKEDGSDIQVAVDSKLKSYGGNHHDWYDDTRLTMNLAPDGENLRFTIFNYDGNGLTTLAEGIRGSGHPTLHTDGIHLVSDTYLWEPMAGGDGTVPIRWVNTQTAEEKTLLHIPTKPKCEGTPFPMRIDPHVVWDRSYRYLTFNGATSQGRGVFIADLIDML